MVGKFQLEQKVKTGPDRGKKFQISWLFTLIDFILIDGVKLLSNDKIKGTASDLLNLMGHVPY